MNTLAQNLQEKNPFKKADTIHKYKTSFIVFGAIDIMSLFFDMGLALFLLVVCILEGKSIVGKPGVWFFVIWLILHVAMVVFVVLPRIITFAIFAIKKMPLTQGKMWAKVRVCTLVL